MWVTILQHLLLRLVSHRHPGHSPYLRHHYNLPIHEVSSQKGANRPINSEISGRDPKLAQSTVLCQNRTPPCNLAADGSVGSLLSAGLVNMHVVVVAEVEAVARMPVAD